MKNYRTGQAYINIEDARKTGNSDHITKTAITETLKFGGNIGRGYYGSVAGAAIFAVVFGVTTGGLGFVVLGAGAVIGSTVGGLTPAVNPVDINLGDFSYAA